MIIITLPINIHRFVCSSQVSSDRHFMLKHSAQPRIFSIKSTCLPNNPNSLNFCYLLHGILGLMEKLLLRACYIMAKGEGADLSVQE